VIPTRSRSAIEQRLRLVVARAGSDPLYVTGACVGGDQMIATILMEFDPHANQCIIVPRDASRVDTEWLDRMRQRPNVDVRMMGRGTTYRDRNLALLDIDGIRPDRLVAFPLYPESDRRSQRSGTWMTVRMARMREIVNEHHVLLNPADLPD
jgi:hypothetical protein